MRHHETSLEGLGFAFFFVWVPLFWSVVICNIWRVL